MARPAEPVEPPHPTGVVLRDGLAWPELLQVVRTAEDTGYGAVFIPEISGREAFSTLAGFAAATDSLRLGTGVVTVWSRAATTTARGAATIQEQSGGRLILGLGAGTPAGPVAGDGGSTIGPIERVSRYVQAIREALPGQVPPIWLAALGDRMVSLAGQIADGVLLNWCTPERVARARELVRTSAGRSGRDPADVTVAVYVRACLGLEDRVAVPALKEMTGQYASIPHYRRQMEAMGLGAEAAVAARAIQEGRTADVPDLLVDALTVWGGRREALERFDAYRRAGADHVLSYPVAARDPYSSVLGTVLAAAPAPAVER